MNGSLMSPRKIGGWLIIAGIFLFIGIVNALFAIGTIYRIGYATDSGILLTVLLIIGLIATIIALFFFFKRYKYFKAVYIGLELFFVLFNFIAFPLLAGIATAVWAVFFIFCMLLSKRAGQTFVYDWDGIPDRARMEKAGMAAFATGTVADTADRGEKEPGSREGQRTLEQGTKKPSGKPLVWVYIVAFAILAAAVILLLTMKGAASPAAPAEPSPIAYAAAEPAGVEASAGGSG